MAGAIASLDYKLRIGGKQSTGEVFPDVYDG